MISQFDPEVQAQKRSRRARPLEEPAAYFLRDRRSEMSDNVNGVRNAEANSAKNTFVRASRVV